MFLWGGSVLFWFGLGLFGAIWGRSLWCGALCGVFWQRWGHLGSALGNLEAVESGSAVLRCGVRWLQPILGRLAANLGHFGADWGHFRAARHKMAAAPRDGGHLGATAQNGGGEAESAAFLPWAPFFFPHHREFVFKTTFSTVFIYFFSPLWQNVPIAR